METHPENAGMPPVEDLESFIYDIRRWSLRMVGAADSSHIGGALSAADIIGVFYGRVLRIRADEPVWPGRDRFVLSKGHCCTALYAALALRGFFPEESLQGYAQHGSVLMGHASHKVPGVEWSTGSLGHGLGLGAGQALAAKRKKEAWRVFAVLSDGELDEGSTWEAVLFAGHHRLGNLCAVVDKNRQQALGHTEGILDLGSLSRKFTAFGWETVEVDGHDVNALTETLSQSSRKGKPRCVIAHTLKGKGVAYMEDQMEWHYRAPKTDELLEKALQQLASAYGRD